MTHENGNWMNEDQRDSHPEPFTFLDISGEPTKAMRWGGEWWFFYWHHGQKSWVSLCKASGEQLREARKQAMPDAHAKQYDNLHNEFERRSTGRSREETTMIDDAYRLSEVPTAQLEAELSRRREAERIAAEAERKAREVLVECPRCNGKRFISLITYKCGYPCDGCGGKGVVKAMLAKRKDGDS